MRLLDNHDYEVLAQFRYEMRRYLRFSEDAARSYGLEPQQYQLLLAVRGMPTNVEPTIVALAEQMQLRHQSVVELIDRMATKGLVGRSRSTTDRRRVVIRLTDEGERLVALAAAKHVEHLSTVAPTLVETLRHFSV